MYVIAVMQTTIWPVALYGAETWTLKKADMKRMTAFEICRPKVERIKRHNDQN